MKNWKRHYPSGRKCGASCPCDKRLLADQLRLQADNLQHGALREAAKRLDEKDQAMKARHPIETAVLCSLAAFSVAMLSLPVGVYFKTRNDDAHVVEMKRQADAQERLARAAERAHVTKFDCNAKTGKCEVDQEGDVDADSIKSLTPLPDSPLIKRAGLPMVHGKPADICLQNISGETWLTYCSQTEVVE